MPRPRAACGVFITCPGASDHSWPPIQLERARCAGGPQHTDSGAAGPAAARRAIRQRAPAPAPACCAAPRRAFAAPLQSGCRPGARSPRVYAGACLLCWGRAPLGQCRGPCGARPSHPSPPVAAHWARPLPMQLCSPLPPSATTQQLPTDGPAASGARASDERAPDKKHPALAARARARGAPSAICLGAPAARPCGGGGGARRRPPARRAFTPRLLQRRMPHPNPKIARPWRGAARRAGPALGGFSRPPPLVLCGTYFACCPRRARPARSQSAGRARRCCQAVSSSCRSHPSVP